MRRVLPVALAVLVLNVGTACAWHQGERVAAAHCERGRVVSCIHRAALHQRQSFGAMLAVGRCESRLNPAARNPQSDATGLFQILFPGTWNTTPYARRSPWSAKWNALAAAWMWARGRRGEWVC